MKKSEIEDILYKYISGTCTPEELDLLLEYLEKDEYLFDRVTGDEWENLLHRPESVSDEEREKFFREARKIIHPPVEKKPIRMIPSAWKIAASVAVLIGLFAILYRYLSVTDIPEPVLEVSYITAVAGRGEQKNMTLADGSSICLNSESQLTFPEQFNAGVREVHLVGEAFFEIARDSLHRFIVNSSDIRIEVLGTSFNVRNYENDQMLSVTVSTGRVMVIAGDNTISLLPNEQLSVNKRSGEFGKQFVPAEKYAQWQSGKLYFNHTPVPEVVETLERHYNVNIRLEKDSRALISGEHDNKNLNAVLEAICFTTGLKYKKIDDIIVLY